MNNIKTNKGCIYSDDQEPIRPHFL